MSGLAEARMFCGLALLFHRMHLRRFCVRGLCDSVWNVRLCCATQFEEAFAVFRVFTRRGICAIVMWLCRRTGAGLLFQLDAAASFLVHVGRTSKNVLNVPGSAKEFLS